MQFTTAAATLLAGLVSLIQAAPAPVPQDPPAGTWSVYIYDDINFRGTGTGMSARLGKCENTPFTNVQSIHPVHSSQCYIYDVDDCPDGAENRSHRFEILQDTQNLNSKSNNLNHWANNVYSIRCDLHT